MGGSSRKKRVNLSLWDRVWSITHPFLDLLSGGYISKLKRFIDYSQEQNRILANRVMGLNSAHENEKREWEKRTGKVETEKEELGLRVSGLEGKLAKTQSTIRYYWANAHEQFQEALTGLREFYIKAGMEVDEKTLLRSVGDIMQRQVMAVKEAGDKVAEANAKVDEMKEVVKAIKRDSILAETLMYLDDTRPVISLGINNVIEAASKTAQTLFNRRVVGEYADSLYDGLSAMIGYVAETYEEGFDLNLRRRTAKVQVRRFGEEYIGAVITFEDRRLLGGLFSRDKIREAVNKAVMLDYASVPSVINLTRLREVSKEMGRRLYGLCRSDYFRKRLSVRVDSAEVYSALEKYGVPHEMMDYTGEFKASTEKGLEGALPEKA
jgi:hypothetical protein